MMLRLQFSGYNKRFREQVLRSALGAFNRLVRLDASGGEPMNGHKDDGENTRSGLEGKI